MFSDSVQDVPHRLCDVCGLVSMWLTVSVAQVEAGVSVETVNIHQTVLNTVVKENH